MKKTIILLTSGILTLGSLSAFADDYRDNDRRRDDDRNRHETRDNHQHSPKWNVNINVNRHDPFDRHSKYRNRYNDRYSVFNNRLRHNSVGIGTSFSNRLFRTGMYGNYSAVPYPPTNTRHLNNRQRNRVIRNHNNHHDSSRIYRDSRGRCFERSYDRHGHEVRVELDRKDCRR